MWQQIEKGSHVHRQELRDSAQGFAKKLQMSRMQTKFSGKRSGEFGDNKELVTTNQREALTRKTTNQQFLPE